MNSVEMTVHNRDVDACVILLDVTGASEEDRNVSMITTWQLMCSNGSNISPGIQLDLPFCFLGSAVLDSEARR